MTANRAIGTRIPDAKGLGGIVSRNKAREDFINQLTNFGAYRNLPPVQRMSDPQKLEEMRRKMEENEQNKQNDEYLMR